jgi:hypothetical protein
MIVVSSWHRACKERRENGSETNCWGTKTHSVKKENSSQEEKGKEKRGSRDLRDIQSLNNQTQAALGPAAGPATS